MLTRIGIFITIIAWMGFIGVQMRAVFEPLVQGQALVTLRILLFAAIVTFLMYGNLVFLFTRIGYLRRKSEYLPLDRRTIDQLLTATAPAVSIVIPSYKEEISVIRKTILSAALQSSARLTVTLLIDDPPNPTNPSEQQALATTRQLIESLQVRFAGEAADLTDAYERFLARESAGSLDLHAESTYLAGWYKRAVWFYMKLAADTPRSNHEDIFFHERILRQPMAHLNAHSRRLRRRPVADAARLHSEYRYLLALFSVELSSFERKQYANLSHKANKAMNVNSYLSVMGNRWRTEQHADGLHLVSASDDHADLVIPSAKYVISLDADSLLLPGYVMELMAFMERSQNKRIAVVQTPYSAFPGAPGQIERIAGATTDIQYIIHQGFTRAAATYWVGANAMIRTEALGDIMDVSLERGYVIRKYIRDRTVIEDTESSIDLILAGWSLHNYPRRLAYSATPPDFGSLIIQRRRWANGGLIILPKLLRFLLLGPRRKEKLLQGFMRVHYLASITGANIAMLMLMFFPFDDDSSILWVVAGSLPYFLLYARDLTLCGYRYTDILRVYTLNLLLIPVNISGVWKSIRQIITGMATPFKRTPKIAGRTAVPSGYILAIWGLALFCSGFAIYDFIEGNWLHGGFSLLNALGYWYAATAYIGVRHSWEDLALAPWFPARGARTE